MEHLITFVDEQEEYRQTLGKFVGSEEELVEYLTDLQEVLDTQQSDGSWPAETLRLIPMLDQFSSVCIETEILQEVPRLQP